MTSVVGLYNQSTHGCMGLAGPNPIILRVPHTCHLPRTSCLLRFLSLDRSAGPTNLHLPWEDRAESKSNRISNVDRSPRQWWRRRWRRERRVVWFVHCSVTSHTRCFCLLGLIKVLCCNETPSCCRAQTHTSPGCRACVCVCMRALCLGSQTVACKRLCVSLFPPWKLERFHTPV